MRKTMLAYSTTKVNYPEVYKVEGERSSLTPLPSDSSVWGLSLLWLLSAWVCVPTLLLPMCGFGKVTQPLWVSVSSSEKLGLKVMSPLSELLVRIQWNYVHEPNARLTVGTPTCQLLQHILPDTQAYMNTWLIPLCVHGECFSPLRRGCGPLPMSADYELVFLNIYYT